MSLLSTRLFHPRVSQLLFANRMATDVPVETVYEKSKEYWAETASSVDGMLGGFEKLHSPDITDSRAFIKELQKKKYLSPLDKAIDCGAGIGRITKHLLMPLFNSVDMVDVTSKFIEQSNEFIGENCAKIGNKFVEGLQTFEPRMNTYNLIWIQWVIGHLTDDDCVKFLKRCESALTNNGCIIVKENHASGEEKDFDVEDYSWTRTGSEYQSLFEQAGLQVVYEKKQKNFPRGMYEVRMYALKPRTFNE